MSELDRCYRILGLEPGASLEDVNLAYKDLVFVWHPDRVPKDNPRLLQKAEDKIKEINHARDTLRKHGRDRQAPKAQPTPTQKQSASTYYQSYYYRPPQPNSQPHQSANHSQTNGHSQGNGHSQKDRAQTGHHQANSGQAHTQPKDQNYYTQSHYRAEYHRSPDTQPHQAHTQTQRPQPTPPPASPYPHSAYYPPHQRAYTPPRPQTPDLSGADLSGQNLQEKDLSGRNLSHANLSNANLSDTFLHKINLDGANLHKANLFRANLLQASLNKADLREANLIGADLSGADLRGADLRGAKIGFDDRIMVKLTGALLTGAIMPNGRIHE